MRNDGKPDWDSSSEWSEWHYTHSVSWPLLSLAFGKRHDG